MTKPRKEGHSIKIDVEVYKLTKEICDKEGYLLGKFIEKCILAELDRRKQPPQK